MLEKLSQWLSEQWAWSSDYDLASATHIGGRRVNQDALLSLKLENHVLFLVADGLGGHSAGELASSGFCKAISELAKEREDIIAKSPVKQLRRLVEDATLKMSEFVKRQTTASNAHTTIAMLFMNKDYMYLVHIGDTRIYRFNSRDIQHRSRDDSFVQLLFEQGEISQQEMETHPMQNRLVKSVCVGVVPDPSIIDLPPLLNSEGMLICSDGFWNNLPEKKFSELLRCANIKTKLNELIELAYENGGPTCDNITAIFVRNKFDNKLSK